MEVVLWIARCALGFSDRDSALALLRTFMEVAFLASLLDDSGSRFGGDNINKPAHSSRATENFL